jgi:hypothetical protein
MRICGSLLPIGTLVELSGGGRHGDLRGGVRQLLQLDAVRYTPVFPMLDPVG